MKNILAISASNSSKSINKKVLELIKPKCESSEFKITLLDLREYEFPLYSADIEEKSGIPNSVKKLFALIGQYDAYILGTPEHNGNLPAFFKNIFDWLTRINNNIFNGKNIVITTASPGKMGGASVRTLLTNSLPFFGAKVLGTVGIANFYDVADLKQIPVVFKDGTIETQLIELVNKLK